MRPLPHDYNRCQPETPDQFCKNCKCWADHPEQTWGSKTPIVNTINSRDDACIYIPISFEKAWTR